MIPVVDLDHDCVVEDFRTAYSEVGFAYLIGHGIPQRLVDDVLAAAHTFHALPLASKMAIELNELHRGFIPINTSTDRKSTLANVRKPNQSESFMMMREAGVGDPDVVAGAFLAGPNQWPTLPRFRETVVAYERAMLQLAQRLTEIVAVVLNDTDRVVPRSFEPPTTWLRLLHYPPDGQWLDAPPQAGTFMMNVGQMLHQWSNGILRATPHRVINRSGRERYSVPFFFDPNVATVIDPLPSCVDTAHPRRFEPVVFGEYLRAELQAGYQRHAKP